MRQRGFWWCVLVGVVVVVVFAAMVLVREPRRVARGVDEFEVMYRPVLHEVQGVWSERFPVVEWGVDNRVGVFSKEDKCWVSMKANWISSDPEYVPIEWNEDFANRINNVLESHGFRKAKPDRRHRPWTAVDSHDKFGVDLTTGSTSREINIGIQSLATPETCGR